MSFHYIAYTRATGKRKKSERKPFSARLVCLYEPKDESKKDLSDVPSNPPSTAGRSQTLNWVEIIATQLQKKHAHVGITRGLEASAHQPGWSLWLM